MAAFQLKKFLGQPEPPVNQSFLAHDGAASHASHYQ
jgi:hypothetical protein